MKRYLSAFVGLVLLAAAGCSSGQPAAAPAGGESGAVGEPYKIGAILDVTGGGSTLAIPERNTLLMLTERVNAQGGITGPDGKQHRLELIIEDNKGQESESVLLANKLLRTDKVPVLIGSSQSGTTLAMLQTVQEAEIPLISLATSVQIVTPVAERKWAFKTPWSDANIVAVIVEDMQSRGFTKIAWLSVNNAYGDSARTEFLRIAPEAGIELVLDDRFDVGVKDLTPLMNRVKASDAQAVVIWALSPETAVAVRGHKALQLKQEVYVSHGVATPQFLELAGSAAEGINMAAGKALVVDQLPDDDPQKAVLDDFNQSYQATFRDPISTLGGHAWDAFHMVIHAFSKVGPDPARIREVLENDVREFVGVTGIFNLSPEDHTGLDARGLAILRVENGSFRLVRTFSDL